MKTLVAFICTLVTALNGYDSIIGSSLIDDIDVFNECCSGMSYNMVHELLGEPPGGLSGLCGDIYFNSNDEAVIIYYDNSGNVDFAILGGWTKPEIESKPVLSDPAAFDDVPLTDEEMKAANAEETTE